MAEKNMQFSLLLDYYGELLPPAQRDMIDLYYNEDLSLSEIAEQIGITRQGVRDSVHRSEEALLSFEDKLGMVKRTDCAAALADAVNTVKALCAKYDDPALADAVDTVTALVREME